MRVLAQSVCAPRIARQSTSSLSKNRYAAMVSAQSPQACGTLAVGWALKRSTSRIARLLRRSSPKSIVSNSVPAQPIVFLQIFLGGNFAGVVYNEMSQAARTSVRRKMS